jgi:EAL domain-containing protein (putative c-di-GMP-specific phosphodiesterase class I)
VVRHLAAAADAALRQARESAEGIVVLRAAPSDAQPAKPPSAMVTLIADALAIQRVPLAGQVAYRLSDHRALHTEIFARLRDANGRQIAAAEFLPTVAAQGLAEQFDRVVIAQAVEAAGGQAEAISLNLSIRSVEQDGFVQWLASLLQREGKLASRLAFEMSESAVLQNEPAVAAFARALAGTGAAFALDNFGMRRDSLALAQRLRPAYIKLAGAQIAAMLTNSGARFYAESLIAAARQLDIPVIAQNVEDESLFQAIAGLGFAGYQGNLGGRPSPWPAKV